MALMKCPECFGNCSDKAAACPHCGFPIQIQSTASNQQKEELFRNIMSLCDKLVSLRDDGVSKLIAIAILTDTDLEKWQKDLCTQIIDFIYDPPILGKVTVNAIIGEKIREILDKA